MRAHNASEDFLDQISNFTDEKDWQSHADFLIALWGLMWCSHQSQLRVIYWFDSLSSIFEENLPEKPGFLWTQLDGANKQSVFEKAEIILTQNRQRTVD